MGTLLPKFAHGIQDKYFTYIFHEWMNWGCSTWEVSRETDDGFYGVLFFREVVILMQIQKENHQLRHSEQLMSHVTCCPSTSYMNGEMRSFRVSSGGGGIPSSCVDLLCTSLCLKPHLLITFRNYWYHGAIVIIFVVCLKKHLKILHLEFDSLYVLHQVRTHFFISTRETLRLVWNDQTASLLLISL